MSALEAKLEAKRAELVTLEAKYDKAHGVAVRATPGLENRDPGVLSGISRKPSPKRDAARFNSYRRESEAGRAMDQCREDIRVLEARIEREARNAPVPFTPEELKAARLVRTHHGWHKVARVNAKSVSVETGYSWTDRYAIEKVLEVR